MRYTLMFTLLFLLLVFKAEGKKGTKKPKISHEKKGSVAQTSLPPATKESDDGTPQSGDRVLEEGSGEESGSGAVEENVNKPENVKSQVRYEKDKNKIAESVKKSVQIDAKGNVVKSKGSAANKVESKQKENNDADAAEDNKGAKNDKNVEDDKKGKKESKSDAAKSKEDKKESESATKKSKSSEKDIKRSKPKHSHHHHHHHHHHDKKNKRPSKKPNPANEPPVNYPTFDWSKDGDKVKNMTTRIPGWGAPANVAQLLALSQMAASGIQKDAISWPIGRLFNGSISNQADIASLDKASIETVDQSAQRDKTSQANAVSSNDTAVTTDGAKLASDDNNPVAETVASDTGEVPQNISRTADVKVPSNIPARCAGLVKLYSNGELTMMDYLKQLRRCKKADSDFNSAHPFVASGNAMLRASLSKNGPALTKQAYQYALERMRNYVPSSKEKQAAEQILAKWRSNSFGSRDGVAEASVPDAVKNFMTGQTAEEESLLQKKQNIQKQKDKAIDTAKKFILGTITGRTGELPAIAVPEKKSNIAANTQKVASSINKAAVNKKAIITNSQQSVANVIAAAKSLIGDANKGQAVVLAPGGNQMSLLASAVKKSAIASPKSALQNKAKALLMAKTAEKLNAALLSQITSNAATESKKTGSDLLAALNQMASGPESPVTSPLSVVSSVQKRSINEKVKSKLKRKRSISPSLMRKSHSRAKKRRRRELIGKPNQVDNPIERSKLNKPIIAAPKLMDRIRDMSMIIATP